MLVPEVSALTNMIVRRMTEKSIERRYQTPMDLAEDVQRAYAELVAKQQVTAKVQCFPSSLSPGETRPDWRAVAERGNAVASDKDSGAMQDSATAKTPVGGVPGTDPTAATTGWVWAKSHTKGRVALLSDAPGQAGTAFTRELCLLTKLANGRSLRIPLVDGEEMYAGRDASTCDIVIEDPTVSSRHCSIVRTGDMVFVQDCGSRNGIRVDGKHVESLTMSEATRRISIGKTSFEIRFGPDRHANDDQYAETPRVLRAVTQPA